MLISFSFISQFLVWYYCICSLASVLLYVDDKKSFVHGIRFITVSCIINCYIIIIYLLNLGFKNIDRIKKKNNNFATALSMLAHIHINLKSQK